MTCEARIVADGEQDGVIWDAIVRAIVSDESHAEPAASGDAHTSAHVASRLVLAMPGHKEDRRSVRGWCDENRCPSAAVAPGSREAVVPIAVTLRFASDGPCLHAAELTQSGAYLSASSSAKCAEAVGLAAAASARALCSAQMVHWASPKGAYSTVRQERLGIVLTIVLPSAGQVDDPECASDLAQAMATDFVPELGQGLQISEGLQGADLQGRVTAMPAWAGGLGASHARRGCLCSTVRPVHAFHLPVTPADQALPAVHVRSCTRRWDSGLRPRVPVPGAGCRGRRVHWIRVAYAAWGEVDANDPWQTGPAQLPTTARVTLACGTCAALLDIACVHPKCPKLS